MIKNILLFFVVTLTTVLDAQNTRVDSLDEKIKSTIGQQPDSAKYYLLRFIAYEPELSDSIMAYAYGRLGTSYGQLGQADSARIYFNKGILKAKNHPTIAGKIYKQLAQAERIFSNYEQAFSALEHAEKMYRESNDLEGVGLVYIERASSYAYMSQEKKAIELLKEAIALFEEIGGSVNMIYAKQELANTYVNNENFNFAKDLYEAILPDVKSETATINYYFTLVNYAYSLSRLSEYEKAEQIYIEALNFFKENNNETFYFYVLNKLGVIYHNKKDYQKAVPYLKDAFLGMYKLQSVYLKSVTVDYLNLLNDIGDYNTSLNVINQIEHIEKSKKIQYNDWTQVSFLENVKETYVKKGNYEKALEVHEKMQVLKDSLSVERNEVELKKIQEEYQNE